MAEISKDPKLEETEHITSTTSGSSTDSGFTTSERSKPSLGGVIKNAVTAPFHHKDKKQENSPALQEAIDKMEARKEATVAKMEAEGKDTSRLSGSRTDRMSKPNMESGWVTFQS